MRSYLFAEYCTDCRIFVDCILLSIRSTEFLNELVCAMKSAKEKNYEIKMRKYNDVEIDMLRGCLQRDDDGNQRAYSEQVSIAAVVE